MSELQLRADLDRPEPPVGLTAEEKSALLDAIEVVAGAIRYDLAAHDEDDCGAVCPLCGEDGRAGAVRLLVTLRMAEAKLVRSGRVLPG